MPTVIPPQVKILVALILALMLIIATAYITHKVDVANVDTAIIKTDAAQVVKDTKTVTAGNGQLVVDFHEAVSAVQAQIIYRDRVKYVEVQVASQVAARPQPSCELSAEEYATLNTALKGE